MKKVAHGSTFCVALLLAACGGAGEGDGDIGSEESRTVNGLLVEASADLTGANLTGADLSGLYLSGVNLSGANMSHKSLKPNNFLSTPRAVEASCSTS